MKKLICFVLIFFQVLSASAWELEGFAGAQATSYDDVSEANSSGVAARAKINFYTQNRGVFTNVNARGISLLTADLIVGYGWRTSGTLFLEVGAGGSVSSIYGTNVALLAGSGYRLSNNLFVNFPVVLAGSGIFWSPYIGYSF
jgi:hypothetical protein